jgi:hypothetical protein
MTPQPWPRTGPGTASDGKPKFDLSRFDQAYFSRLRDRVIAAGNHGIYVSVMLFEGHGLTSSPRPTMSRAIRATQLTTSTGSGSPRSSTTRFSRSSPRSRRSKEAYLRKVLDTIHDLPNVLYEVANESSGATADSVTLPDGSSIATSVGDSTQWQYWVIEFVKQYEQEVGHDPHPVGDADAVSRAGPA